MIRGGCGMNLEELEFSRLNDDCVDSDDYDFDCDDLNWTYIYASEDDKEA